MPSENGGTAEDGVLTEDCILRASRQYDVEMIFQVSLRSRGLRLLSDGFVNCCALTRVDLSRNRLASLEGIALLADSLTHINVSENEIEDVVGIDRCSILEEVLLEGNQLSKATALAPLAQLPKLRCLVLQREIPLSNDTDETLLLDNPICREREVYEKLVRQHFSAVLCVDGRCFRDPSARELVAETVSSSPSMLLLSKAALKDMVDLEDDLDKRIFANAVVECHAACRKALLS
ncbi:putative leucine-rich repeat protein (LRRP) [Trypanosoma rangeli]|uniref:Putative leucine-rich repeat protein (LRRP) n=1 Tax=Trypanosoma rangeli TaxID=5698 RepID=A0A3R7KRR0_TRYRA|nr:putative leucine-rich repeat protein (LRRP) [Trypanosoma rangeli]RNF08401.1 putative leucine-rich repeat protein (LRRP) [Trypanosoma rangeli]|eukprot:RNF08401.1 putative leucine-rich repeat protein (LRRP) [Trypanosoma rangeli]